MKRSYQGHEALTFCKFLALYLLTALSPERIPQLVKHRIQQVKGRRPCPFDPLCEIRGVGWDGADLIDPGIHWRFSILTYEEHK